MKRIRIDIEAYHALCRHRWAGQSLSDVIKTRLSSGVSGSAPASPGLSGAALKIALGGLKLDRSTLDEVDRIIAARKAHPASGGEL